MEPEAWLASVIPSCSFTLAVKVRLCGSRTEPFPSLHCLVIFTSEHGMISTGRRSSPTISMKISSL